MSRGAAGRRAGEPRATGPGGAAPGDFREHPAHLAWAACAGGGARVRAIEVLKEDERSRVYRLLAGVPGAPNVIAKSSSRERMARERTAYERILPRLGVAVARYLGCAEAGAGREPYLFVEEVAGEEYSAALGEHRRLAGEWLGRFHVGSSALAAGERYFESGPASYREELALGEDALVRHRANPRLREADLRVLDDVVAQCAIVRRHWAELEGFCSAFPRCYVHGDFKSDNVRVVRDAAGRGELVAFDWASITLQTPAVDVTILFTKSFSKEPLDADIGAYCSVVQRAWPRMDAPLVRRLAYVGEVFRWAKAVRWAAEELQYEWTEQATYLLGLYRAWMEDVIAVAPWEDRGVTRDRVAPIAIRGDRDGSSSR